MKLSKTELRPTPFLIGAGLAAIAFLGVGASLQSTAANALRVNLDPPASNIVRVAEGEVFTVPQGRGLVIKAGGVSSVGAGFGNMRIRINGIAIIDINLDFSDPKALPFPIAARAGDTVTVEEAFGDDPLTTVVIMGYLTRE